MLGLYRASISPSHGDEDEEVSDEENSQAERETTPPEWLQNLVNSDPKNRHAQFKAFVEEPFRNISLGYTRSDSLEQHIKDVLVATQKMVASLKERSEASVQHKKEDIFAEQFTYCSDLLYAHVKKSIPSTGYTTLSFLQMEGLIECIESYRAVRSKFLNEASAFATDYPTGTGAFGTLIDQLVNQYATNLEVRFSGQCKGCMEDIEKHIIGTSSHHGSVADFLCSKLVTTKLLFLMF